MAVLVFFVDFLFLVFFFANEKDGFFRLFSLVVSFSLHGLVVVEVVFEVVVEVVVDEEF